MLGKTGRTWGWSIVGALSVLAEGLVAEESCAAWRAGLRAGDAVSFHAAAGEATAILEAAIGTWSGACGAGPGRGLPWLEARGGDATYQLVLRGHNHGGPQCGTFRGRTLTVFQFATAPGGERLHCGDRVLVLAHEIGHVLGLSDVDAGRCPSSIMAGINRANKYLRRVQVAECEAVAEAWTTVAELESRRAAGEPAVRSAAAREDQAVGAGRGGPGAVPGQGTAVPGPAAAPAPYR